MSSFNWGCPILKLQIPQAKSPLGAEQAGTVGHLASDVGAWEDPGEARMSPRRVGQEMVLGACAGWRPSVQFGAAEVTLLACCRKALLPFISLPSLAAPPQLRVFRERPSPCNFGPLNTWGS